MTNADEPTSRGDRRRRLTRAALVRAAQTVMAQGRTSVPVLEITQLADVGLGSFYNHFDSKEALFAAAVVDALERHADLLDSLTVEIDDPAVVFAQSVRLTGRLHRLVPEMSRVLLHHGLELVQSDIGLAPRALRDLTAGVRAGRFTSPDLEVSLAIVAGAVLGLGTLVHAQPGRDDGAAADQVTEDLLRMLGLTPEEAREICQMPLPDVATMVETALTPE